MIKNTLFVISGLLFVLFSYLIGDYFFFKKEQDILLFEEGQRNSVALRNDVNATLERAMKLGHEIVDTISDHTFTKKELQSLVKTSTIRTIGVYNVAVGYEPYGFDKDTELFCPSFNKGKYQMLQIEELYDYVVGSKVASQWYAAVLERKKAFWMEPYYAESSKTLVADYVLPFYYKSGTKKGQIRGVVKITLSLKRFQQFIHSLSLGKTGYGFVSSKKGVLLSHPIDDYLGKVTLQDLGNIEDNPELKNAFDSMLNGKSGSLVFKDKSRKDKKLFFYDKIPVSSWGIGIIYNKNDMIVKGKELKRKYIDMAVALGLLVLTLLIIVFYRNFYSVFNIWYLSFSSLVVFIGLTVFIGYLQHIFPNDSVAKEYPVTSLSEVDSFTESFNAAEEKRKRRSWEKIPTGIYIDKLEFEDTYNVNVSGIVWQRFDTISASKFTAGFRFPQISPFAESSYIEEKGRYKYGKKLLIHYAFRTTIRLPFQYKDYPFDKRNIYLELQPLDFREKMFLVPDLGGYDNTAPSKMNGINPDIELSGDKIVASNFSYSIKKYTTDFGYRGNDHFNNVPILSYAIKIRRELLTSFVTYLFPVVITLLLLFFMIIAIRRPKKNGKDAAAIVQGIAAFLFVLVFSHIDLRKDIVTGDLIYMEYFYFVSYVMIVLTTYNLIIYTRMSNRIFDYKENIVVKVIFWPTFFFMILLITLFKFY